MHYCFLLPEMDMFVAIRDLVLETREFKVPSL